MPPIPAWNTRGVIPPLIGSNPVSSASRSPFRATLKEVVEGFGKSADRRAILTGLLNYRAALHAVGMVHGFQWLDGSFLEDIETLESRPPGDIDVVSFFVLAPGQTQGAMHAANPMLFPSDAAGHDALKAAYRVDAFYQGLQSNPVQLVGRATYWHSMWAHRRDLSWKGYLQVSLDPAEDAAAQTALASLSVLAPAGVTP